MLCTVTLLRVDWEAEARLAQVQQRTIDSLEAAIAFGASPERVLEQEAQYQATEEGAHVVGRPWRVLCELLAREIIKLCVVSEAVDLRIWKK